MREKSATVHPALQYRCPFCHADPGEECRTRTGGRVNAWSHSRRIALTRPTEERLPRPDVKALCCDCGQLRTVSANYHFGNDQNRSDGYFYDSRGWSHTGTLKCVECGRPTRHALLRGEDDKYRDHDEDLQRYVLGGEWSGKYPPDRDRLRDRYQKQLPRNPKLTHRFWIEDANKRREEGQTHMPAVCGAVAEIPRSWSKQQRPVSELIEPDRIDWDTEFEDASTGMWWVDMDCVDCLRVANERRQVRSRERAKYLIDWYSTRIDRLNHAEVEALIAFLEPAANETFERWQREKAKLERKDEHR